MDPIKVNSTRGRGRGSGNVTPLRMRPPKLVGLENPFLSTGGGDIKATSAPGGGATGADMSGRGWYIMNRKLPLRPPVVMFNEPRVSKKAEPTAKLHYKGRQLDTGILVKDYKKMLLKAQLMDPEPPPKSTSMPIKAPCAPVDGFQAKSNTKVVGSEGLAFGSPAKGPGNSKVAEF